MTPFPTFRALDREFHPEQVLRSLEESTIQYAGALLRLAALSSPSGVHGSPAYCRAYDALYDQAEQYQWARGMEQLVMRN
ncbi:MAG: hypothetical protein AABX13_06020 [Nanoarchaeota archaeon]